VAEGWRHERTRRGRDKRVGGKEKREREREREKARNRARWGRCGRMEEADGGKQGGK